MSDQPQPASPPAVLVECITPRPPTGTEVILGPREAPRRYQFKANAEGREFCVITEPDDLAALLRIPEAYRMVSIIAMGPAAITPGAVLPADTPPAIAAVVTPEPTPEPVLVPNPAPAEGEGTEGTGEELTPAPEGSTVVPSEAVAGSEAPETHPLDHDADGKPGGAAPAEPDPIPADLASLDLEALQALFLKEIGRKPNARAKAELLIAQITAHRAEVAGA